MRLAVLYSGGKDSTLALMRAMELHEPVCLISVISENPHSYMYHTPNIDMTALQSRALGLPLVSVDTKGEKEYELEDLKRVARLAKEKYQIDGIVTGAVRSTYQASRVQRVCHSLDLWCFNPLWLKDQEELLKEVVRSGISAIISSVAAESLDESFLGKRIDDRMVARLVELSRSKGINPAGEGGEFESTVLDAPVFKKRIEILRAKSSFKGNSGLYHIENARLCEK
ncbi:diphthine--ammonia ligase [Candidatus Woesearchaeota archaeon]|nr:MAG: diphthine--ammonia ligase [Candidatus Woesearchaeota archaeon]